MKPVVIPTLEYTHEGGGVAEYIAHLERTLQDRGIATAVAYEPLQKLWKPQWLPMLIRVLWLCTWPSKRPRALLVQHILPVGTVAFLMRKLFDVPYVLFFHGYDAALAASATGLKKRLAQRILGAASLVVVNSNATGKSVTKLGGAAWATHPKMVVVYPCPAVAPHHATSSNEPSSANHKSPTTSHSQSINFLSVSRLVARKGTAQLIEAFANVHKHRQNTTFTIVGDGPERANLEDLTRQHDLTSVVTFVGKKSANECEQYFAATDIFVLTPQDRWPDVEGFGMVYLEAAAFGKPSIGSDAGGVPEAVQDGVTGVIIPQGNTEALARAMEQLAGDAALRERLGAAGRKRVQDAFVWRKQLEPVISWIQQL